MPTDKKLIIAILVLVVLGGAVFLQKQKQSADLAAHSLEGVGQSLPKITISDDDIKKIDKVELTRPGEHDGGAPENIVLVKKGDEDWDLDKPAPAKGNASNVKSMLDALKRLEAKELIDSSKASYAKYKVSDGKALHAVFYKGKDVALDAYFGEDGSRGQMTRLAGKDGVFAVKGYSSYLFNRDAKSWRDKTIFKFEEKDVQKVTLENENGKFTFEKSGEDWKAKHTKAKSGDGKDIEKFDKTKLESLVRAYKALSAADFGDGKKPADTGLTEPKATLTFDMTGGSAKYVVTFGSVDGSNRWMKKNGSDEIWSVSSWAGDWATANVDKFQKTEEKKDDKDKKGDKGKDMPHMPGMPPGMPPGMGHPPVGGGE
jgi:hypothetical protein